MQTYSPPVETERERNGWEGWYKSSVGRTGGSGVPRDLLTSFTDSSWHYKKHRSLEKYKKKIDLEAQKKSDRTSCSRLWLWFGVQWKTASIDVAMSRLKRYSSLFLVGTKKTWLKVTAPCSHMCAVIWMWLHSRWASVTQASREVKSLMICFLPSAERWLTCGDSKSWLILGPWPASWQIKGATWWHHDLFSFWLCACGCTGQRHCRVCNATLVLIRCLRGNQLSSFPYVNN